MRSFPGKRGLPGFEKAIDHHRISLGGSVRARAGRGAADNSRTTVDRDAGRVGKLDAATEGNSFWVNRNMTVAEPRTIGGRAELAFAGPVNRDSREQRTFRRKSRSRDQKSKAKRW